MLEDKELTISKKSELLGISRSSIYYKPVPPSEEEIQIKNMIDKLYTSRPASGYKKITERIELEYGICVNHKRVYRYMQEMGIQGIHPQRNLSKSQKGDKKYPYLLKGLDIKYPDQVWGVDITYIPMNKGFMYLVAIIDWYSRYVVSYELNDTLEIGFVISACEKALKKSVPEIMNSDQGSHFTSEKYLDLFLKENVRISMDHKGRAFDNILTERLWRTIKYEDIYIQNYENPRQLNLGLKDYLVYYNDKRPHQSLNNRTPAEIYYIDRRDHHRISANLDFTPQNALEKQPTATGNSKISIICPPSII